jgi:hypothetical protein
MHSERRDYAGPEDNTESYIKRLKAELKAANTRSEKQLARMRQKNELIDELAEALDRSDPIYINAKEVKALIKRARRETIVASIGAGPSGERESGEE